MSRPVYPFAIALTGFVVIQADLALAQTVLEASDDAVIRDSLCLGGDCPDSPSFEDGNASTLLLRGARTRIDFEDTTGQFDLQPKNDWSILINDNGNNGDDYFAVADRSSDTIPVRVMAGTPSETLYLDDFGIGLGTTVPLTPLHLWRNDGTAQILVEETSATVAPRTLFTLANSGNTKFEIFNTDADNRWAFTNSGTDFRVSLQDSGQVEFRVDNDGNAFVAGDLEVGGTLVSSLALPSDRALKQDLEPVDPKRILDQVAGLAIGSWSYRKAPDVKHLGPMAQDFHATFGIGADDRSIAVVDASGVALAAIQALKSENDSLREQNEALARRLELIEIQLAHLLRDQGRRSMSAGKGPRRAPCAGFRDPRRGRSRGAS